MFALSESMQRVSGTSNTETVSELEQLSPKVEQDLLDLRETCAEAMRGA
jgi:hypothetical protein